MTVWSRKTLTKFQIFAFFGKATLMGKVSKFCSKRIHSDTDPRVVLKFREIWPMRNRWSRALFTWQEKFRLVIQLWLLCRLHPKICPAQPQTMYWESESDPDFIQIGSLSAELYPNTWTPSKQAVKCFQYSAEAYLASSQIINNKWSK